MSAPDDADDALDAHTVDPAVLQRIQASSSRRERTFLAAEHLFVELGVQPSAHRVRALTGRGSMTDIQSDLRAFWAHLREKGRQRLQGVPEPLSQSFGAAIGTMWEAALKAAGETFEAEREAARATVQEAEARAAADRVQLELALAQAASLADQLVQMREAASIAASQLSQALDAVRAAEERTRLAESKLSEAEHGRAQLQTLLGEGLDSLRQSTNKASDAFRGEVNFLKVQVDNARAAERDLREQLQTARQSRDLELQVLRQQNNGLLETNGRLSLANQDLVERMAALTARLAPS